MVMALPQLLHTLSNLYTLLEKRCQNDFVNLYKKGEGGGGSSIVIIF